MKKIHLKYIPVLAAIFGFSLFGCNKVLDMKPLNEISDVDYWKTADQYKLAANEFYTYLRTFSDVIGDAPHSDLRADFITSANRNVFSSGTNTAPQTDGGWNTGYSRLRSINYLLEKASAYQTPAEITHYVAESKFFRGYIYFDLLQQFGGVPLVTKSLGTESPELQAARNSRDEVADLIIKDLEEAIAVLPNESAISGANKGRISKEAAQAFLARVALYEGTWQKFRNNAARANTLLDKAIANSNAVITGNQFQLFAPAALGDSAQKYMFILENEKSNPAGITKAGNKEYILANKYDFTLRQSRINITQGVHGNGNVNWLTKKLADMYLTQKGLPIDHPNSGFAGYARTRSEYENRDNRMKYNLMIDSNYHWDNENPGARTTWIGDAPDIANSKGRHNAAYGTGYHNQKWATERRLNDNEESYDYPVIRYAEVLLTYAEAVFERNDAISDADLDKSLNLVRSRVNKTMPKLSNGFVTANGLNMRTEIRRERNIELYYEGFRLDDLKRWKTAETEMPMPLQGVVWTGTRWQTRWTGASSQLQNGIVTIEGSGRQWTEKHYLLPIPTQQIALNRQINQNTGW